jgi:Ca2+-binding RTX toxin-like protein
MSNPMRTVIDVLEPRTHLSTSLNSDGILNITGTDLDDTIVVQIVDRRLAVTINGARERFTLSSVHRLTINASDGSDQIDFRFISLPTFARGGNGNDAIFAGAGDDRLHGDGGNDQLYGGGGGDQLDGGAGSDLLSGGDGRDSVNYSDRITNLTLSIARGGYDDGEFNEHDNIRNDIEGVSAGRGYDVITGWKSSDVISGGAGNDTIKGDDGADTINGDDGDDVIEGNGNNDRLSGGDGDDYLNAGNGRNLMYGNAGDDRFDSVNGNTDDALDGGSGFDRADLDARVSDGGDVDRDNTRSVERKHYDF